MTRNTNSVNKFFARILTLAEAEMSKTNVNVMVAGRLNTTAYRAAVSLAYYVKNNSLTVSLDEAIDTAAADAIDSISTRW